MEPRGNTRLPLYKEPVHELERAKALPKAAIDPRNSFGLENTRASLESYGREVFTAAELHMLEFAAEKNNKNVREQFRESQDTITLPDIESERMSAQMLYRSDVLGGKIISLIDNRQRDRGVDAGFHLVQNTNGFVSVVHADISRRQEWSPIDPDYVQAIDATNAYLNEYFKLVADMNKSDIFEKITGVENPSLHDVRQNIGTASIKLFGIDTGKKRKRSDREVQKLLKKITGDK